MLTAKEIITLGRRIAVPSSKQCQWTEYLKAAMLSDKYWYLLISKSYTIHDPSHYGGSRLQYSNCYYEYYLQSCLKQQNYILQVYKISQCHKILLSPKIQWVKLGQSNSAAAQHLQPYSRGTHTHYKLCRQAVIPFLVVH
jgi:hypothetical protein